MRVVVVKRGYSVIPESSAFAVAVPLTCDIWCYCRFNCCEILGLLGSYVFLVDATIGCSHRGLGILTELYTGVHST